MKEAGLQLLPPYPVDVTDSNGFHQHNKQQWEGGCVVIEDVKPVISSLHGEDQANYTIHKTHNTCMDKTGNLPLHL